MKKIKGFFKNDCGATAVEMALLVPILMIIMIGILDLGRFYWIQHELQFAVEKTARHALINNTATEDELEDYIQDNLTFSDKANVSVEFLTETVNEVTFIIIDANYTFQFASGYIDFGDTTLSGYIRTPVQ